MDNEPLVFVEVALVNAISNNIQDILGDRQFLKTRDPPAAFAPTTAIFYSISSTQAGLSGIDLGNFLIKQVVSKMKAEFPSVNTFSTLSPMPGFLSWLFNKIGKFSLSVS